MARHKAKPTMQWVKVDLHIHTPVSSLCYADKNVRFLDILRTAEAKGLDVIAITDHNTVSAIAAFRRRLETLQYLEEQGRLSPEEKEELDEYYRIMNKVLVLPGFEFTATLGFHILGIFPPDTSVRKMEHVLLELNVPEEKLDSGTSEIGATSDVLRAYQILDEAGALVIAAHANSTHGVAMQNFNFGGQTKISYTQDQHLHALEVTDLGSKSRRSTQNFYNGTKSEYPRRMHCIQGSDAHRLEREQGEKSTGWGIGDRVTEMLLPEVSFQAIKELLQSDDFTRTRPYTPVSPLDAVRQAQEAGPGETVSFHERAAGRNKSYDAVLQDIVAMANSRGGTIYLGAGGSAGTIRGLQDHEQVVGELEAAIDGRLAPKPALAISPIQDGGKVVVTVVVEQGAQSPYVLDGNQVWVRRGAESVQANRQELIQLVLRGAGAPVLQPQVIVADGDGEQPASSGDSPCTGVEIVDSYDRNGVMHHTVRDLRNNSVVQNVTRFSARRLWRYAITEHENHRPQPDDIEWRGDLGLWKTYKRNGQLRYNLVKRDEDGSLHLYYGVTDDGLCGQWSQFALAPDVAAEQAEEPVPDEPAMAG